MQDILLVHGTARILPDIACGDDMFGDSELSGRHYLATVGASIVEGRNKPMVMKAGNWSSS